MRGSPEELIKMAPGQPSRAKTLSDEASSSATAGAVHRHTVLHFQLVCKLSIQAT